MATANSTARAATHTNNQQLIHNTQDPDSLIESSSQDDTAPVATGAAPGDSRAQREPVTEQAEARPAAQAVSVAARIDARLAGSAEHEATVAGLLDFILPSAGRTAAEKVQAILDAGASNPDVAAHIKARTGELLAKMGERKAGAGEREQNIALTTERFELYKREFGGYRTGEHLCQLLYMRERSESPVEFEREMIAFSVALLLESDETPLGLHNLIADEVINMHNKAEIYDVLDPENVREQFGAVVAALAGDGEPEGERELDDEPNDRERFAPEADSADEDPTGTARRYVEALAELLVNPQTPDDTRRDIADTAAGLLDDACGDLAARLYVNQEQIASHLAGKSFREGGERHDG